MDISDAAAIVSGGASGLGAAVARQLAAAGAHVVVADLDGDGGAAVAAEIGGTFVMTDVTDARSVADAVAATDGRPLRVAVTCAGIAPAARTLNREGAPISEERFRKVLDVNLVGTFQVLRLAAAAMAAAPPTDDGARGVIVLTSSIAASEGQVGQLAYASSKGAVTSMTLTAARDLAAVGVRVCAVAPGTFETPLLGTLTERQREEFARDVVFPPRVGRPDEFAALVAAIIGIDYLNGEVIRLDGGLRMGVG